MGCCASEVPKQKKNPQVIQHVQIPQYIPEEAPEPENINKFYESYFIYDKHQRLGHGIKQTMSYTSRISKQQLYKKQEEFWETRIEGNQQSWQALHAACEEGQSIETATVILQAAGIKLVNKSLQVSYDETGFKYHIPIFCINLPQEYLEKRNSIVQEEFEEQIIDLILRDNFKNQFDVQMSNTQTGEEVKLLYLEKINEKEQGQNIKVFFRGKELKNSHALGQHNIQNQFVLSVLYFKQKN